MKAQTWNLDQVKAAFKDSTFIPFTLIWITHGIGAFGITFVLPTVIYELGISDTAITQVMTMVSRLLPPEEQFLKRGQVSLTGVLIISRPTHSTFSSLSFWRS